MRSIITLLLASASVVVAQNATFPCLTETELDSKIPECARECQKTAIINDGCDYEDVGCHCLNTGLLGNYLIPCLANSTCSSDDLTVLDNTIKPVCAYFNGTNDGSIPKPWCDSESAIPSSYPPLPVVTPSPSYLGPPEHTPCSDGTVNTSASEESLTVTYGPEPTEPLNYASASSTPSSTYVPLQYWGNGASSSQVISGALVALVGSVAALFL